MIKKIIYGIVALILISSCTTIPADYETLKMESERLKNENKHLKNELEECKFGANKIAAVVEKTYKEKNYVLARKNIELLYEKHPESPKNKEFKELLKTIKKEEEKREQIRLANLDNTGIWTVRYYVDEFDEPTKTGYITNTLLIRGAFSNTATQDSKLDVRFLISDSSNISIKLFEYAGNNPIKSYSNEKYTILIQDKDGNRVKILAINSSDRLKFYLKSYSNQVHNILMKGGTVKFKITEKDTPTSTYHFTIQNADWYENAYRLLTDS